MNQQPLLILKVTKAGAELILNSLAQLPYAQSAGLIRELEAQANAQLERAQQAAQAAEAAAATNPSPDAEQAPSAPADPVPAAS